MRLVAAQAKGATSPCAEDAGAEFIPARAEECSSPASQLLENIGDVPHRAASLPGRT